MNLRYSAPAVVAVLDATSAIKGFDKESGMEGGDPSQPTASAAYTVEQE